MSATATPQSPKSQHENRKEHAPITIPFPADVFEPWEITIKREPFLPNLPTSFLLIPELQDGNIDLAVEDVHYNRPEPPNPPIWEVSSATTNAMKTLGDGSVSMALKSSLGDLLVLTGDSSGHTWSSSISNTTGTWTLTKQKGQNSSFRSRFSWTFLLEQKGEKPETVIFGFEIFLPGGQTEGQLKQIHASFPKGWEITGDKCLTGGIVLQLKGPDGDTYLLRDGLFAGAFGALVCQGKMDVNPKVGLPSGRETDATVQGAPSSFDGGTWTGTSGGPPSPGM